MAETPTQADDNDVATRYYQRHPGRQLGLREAE